jgi:predicted O-methyltransferase YrrM
MTVSPDQVRAFAKENWDEFARILAEVLPEHVTFKWGEDPGYKRHFRAWQQAGVTILPNHFYQPVPDLNSMSSEALNAPLPMHGIDMRDDAQLALLSELSRFKPEYSKFATREPQRGLFRFGGAYPPGDAELLYAMVRHTKPERIVEIGSGFSTLAMAEACVANAAEGAPVDFVSIDPYASWVAEEEPRGLSKFISEPVEGLDLSIFTELKAGDILFIDSSHIWRPGNDVDYEYFKILPLVQPGVLIHIHDIFLPDPYPPSWVVNEHMFWNEQILLAAFLSFNTSFQVELAAHYLESRHFDALIAAVPNVRPKDPGSIWLKRIA